MYFGSPESIWFILMTMTSPPVTETGYTNRVDSAELPGNVHSGFGASFEDVVVPIVVLVVCALPRPTAVPSVPAVVKNPRLEWRAGDSYTYPLNGVIYSWRYGTKSES